MCIFAYQFIEDYTSGLFWMAMAIKIKQYAEPIWGFQASLSFVLSEEFMETSNNRRNE